MQLIHPTIPNCCPKKEERKWVQEKKFISNCSSRIKDK